MNRNFYDYTDYILKDVTERNSLWQGKDPVRPHLSSTFKSSEGRFVFGLYDSVKNDYAAFICIAITKDVPKDEGELKMLTCKDGSIAVPYSVWSSKPGAGKVIVNRAIEFAAKEMGIQRVVTLSPRTGMAKRFHLKNNAKEVMVSDCFINFEYKVRD
mgnify:CR=1 FL=1